MELMTNPETTINGVVINVGGATEASPPPSAKKSAVKRVRREASFRLFASGSKPTVQASSSGSTPSPSPFLGPQDHYRSGKAFSAASPASSSTVNIINAGANETYKSLGDVFGINAAVSSMTENRQNKLAKNTSLPLNGGHISLRNGDTAIYRVNQQSRPNPSHRNSTYSNVSVPVAARFGTQEARASYNERLASYNNKDVYKSNSSLDIDQEVDLVERAVAGANLLSSAAPQLQRKPESSPKVKKKGFFSSEPKANNQKSLFKKFKSKDESSSEQTDRHRRRFFSHYDIGSMCALLAGESALKSLERRNTTTGASAACAALRGTSSDQDQGDNVNNDLVLR